MTHGLLIGMYPHAWRTFTKTFKEEREMNIMMLLDISSSLYYDVGGRKRDMAGYIFSLIAHAANANNDRVGTLLFSDRVEQYHAPMKGKKNILKQVSQVLSYQPVGQGSDLGQAIRTAQELMKKKRNLFYYIRFQNRRILERVIPMARKHDVIAISLFDKSERELPRIGFVELQDRETGKRQIFHGGSRTLRDEYYNFWDIHNYKLLGKMPGKWS
jgi:uncharacterized protein (DUF58 family)